MRIEKAKEDTSSILTPHSLVKLEPAVVMIQEETRSLSTTIVEPSARERSSHLFIASSGQILLLNDYQEFIASERFL